MKLDTSHKPVERRIQAFERRFGKEHLFFAYHAAFPLALTPDLLQSLWANFRCDTKGEVLDIPWVAVNDFLLSGLCEEVGEELYEMDAGIRNLLLDRLQAEQCFQQKRIQELSTFLLAYAEPLSKSGDRDLQDFAQAQRWTALAYSQPEQAAKELALALSNTYQDTNNRDDIIRISEIVETLKNPLSEFEQLLSYARGMVDLVRGNIEAALRYFETLNENNNIVEISEISCLIPRYAGIEEVQENIEKPLISLKLLHFLIFLFFTLVGGGGLWIYFLQSSPTSKPVIGIEEIPDFSITSFLSPQIIPIETNSSSQGYLTVGSQGSAVEELQTLLRNRGYAIRYGANGGGRGKFGPQTFSALRSFQHRVGLEVDGVAGPRTMSALRGGQYRVIIGSGLSLNIRNSPSINASVVGNLKNGATVNVIGFPNPSWAQIGSGQYVASRYLKQ